MGTLLGIAVVLAIPAIVILAILYSIARDWGGLSAIHRTDRTEALVQSVTDTGVRVTRWYLGANALMLRLDLLVTPPGGGEPFPLQEDCPCPADFAAALVPGARIPVYLAKDRSEAAPDWRAIGGGSQLG